MKQYDMFSESEVGIGITDAVELGPRVPVAARKAKLGVILFNFA